MDYVWDYKDPYEFDRHLRTGMPPLVISVAITGGAAGKETNPSLPETPEEQARAAYEAYDAGACAVHIHARDPQKGYAYPSSNPAHYLEINKRIRELCPDIIINDTTGGGPVGLTSEQRMKSLDARPELASLNCGPLILKGVLPKRAHPLSGRDEDLPLDDIIIPVTVGEVERYAKAMVERDIKPELEIYNPQQFNIADILIQAGLLRKPYWFCLIFSNLHGGLAVAANINNLKNMIHMLPLDSLFQVIGVGYTQLFITTAAIVLGGHVRVGMEDNVFYRRGELLKSNAQAVERVVRLARELGREIATPQQARKMLGLSETPRQYS